MASDPVSVPPVGCPEQTGAWTTTSIRREYIWDPRDTDRLLAQVDGPLYWFTPTDETWTPLALVQGGTSPQLNIGRALTQFSYDPFGTQLNRDEFNWDAAGGVLLDAGFPSGASLWSIRRRFWTH